MRKPNAVLHTRASETIHRRGIPISPAPNSRLLWHLQLQLQLHTCHWQTPSWPYLYQKAPLWCEKSSTFFSEVGNMPSQKCTKMHYFHIKSKPRHQTPPLLGRGNYGTFVPKNFRLRDESSMGWNFRPRELSFSGTNVPWMEHSSPGTFVPGDKNSWRICYHQCTYWHIRKSRFVMVCRLCRQIYLYHLL